MVRSLSGEILRKLFLTVSQIFYLFSGYYIAASAYLDKISLFSVSTSGRDIVDEVISTYALPLCCITEYEFDLIG